MIRILKKIVFLLTTAFLVFALSKAIIRTLPGDPIDQILAETGSTVSAQDIRKELGLDRSYVGSLKDQVAHALRGDFGISLVQRRPIAPLLKERSIRSIVLAISAFSLGIPFSFFLALFATLPNRFRKVVDRIISLHSAFLAAMPTAWFAPILAWLFVVKLGWFNLGGSLALPAVTLAVSLSGFWARAFRELISDEIKRDHFRAAQARGTPSLQLIIKHAFLPALGPLSSYFGTQLGSLFAGAVVTETLFDWPGLGSLFVDSLFKRDYPLIEATLFFSSIFILSGNLLGDFLHRLLQPKLREQENA